MPVLRGILEFVEQLPDLEELLPSQLKQDVLLALNGAIAYMARLN